MNTFPPQAYTRDTLSAAYQWLHSQPASIRELAQDSDSLVALYLQASRRPGSLPKMTHDGASARLSQESARKLSTDISAKMAADTSGKTEIDIAGMKLASSETFKQDLKNLAEGLRQFEAPEDDQIWKKSAIESQQPVEIPKDELRAAAGSSRSGEFRPITTDPSPASTERAATSFLELDPKSLEAIAFVQKSLNLSHPNEALRAVISLGFAQAREFFPPKKS